jgi:hypothetical protein
VEILHFGEQLTMFATLQSSNTVLNELHKAAALVKGAAHDKDSAKMAKVLSLLQGLQGNFSSQTMGKLAAPHATHPAAQAQAVAGSASGGIGDLADIMAGKVPVP